MAGPGAAGPDRLEGGNARRQSRPDDIVEMAPDDVEIVAVRIVLLGRRDAANIIFAFRPDIDAGRIDDQRAISEPLLGAENEDRALAPAHRNRDAEHFGEPGCARRAGGVDECAAGDALAGREARRDDALAIPLELDDRGFAIFGAEALGLAAKGLHQRIAVEPAFVLAAPGAERDAVEIEEGKALGERSRFEENDVRAFRALHDVIFGEDLRALVARQIEIAVLAERQFRPDAVGGQGFMGFAQEGDAIEADLDVDRGRELLPD